MGSQDSSFFLKYTIAWVCFCLAAVAVMLADRKRLAVEWQRYLLFLAVPWKLALFACAFLFVTFAGRFTNDETWDWVTGGGMSLLTFLTAPWAIGLIYQVAVGRRPWRYLIVAVALMLFSSSWFYDAYLVLRDGRYTVRWLGNLMLSPFIYVAAGLLWNLEAIGEDERRESVFAFVRPDWPTAARDRRFGPLVYVCIPFVLIAIFVLVGFVGWHF